MTGSSLLASRSGTRPCTMRGVVLGAMKRLDDLLGRMLTYSFSVSMSVLPAFSASQRCSVASDQTLPTPACFSTAVCTSSMVASVCGA